MLTQRALASLITSGLALLCGVVSLPGRPETPSPAGICSLHSFLHILGSHMSE